MLFNKHKVNMASMNAPVCLILLLVLGQVWTIGVAKGAVIPSYDSGSKLCSGAPKFSNPSGSSSCELKLNPVNMYPSGRTPVANRLCTQPIPTDLLKQVGKIFTSGKPPSISKNTGDLYINITKPETYFKITYLKSDCQNRNVFGYFSYDWKKNSYQTDPSMGTYKNNFPGPVIFYQMSTSVDRCYSKGYSIEYGPFDEGKTIGFYLSSDATPYVYNSQSNLLPRTYYTINSMNKADYKPVNTWVYMPSIGQYVIGLDDNGVSGYRDLDYDDLLLLLELNRNNVSIIDPPIYEDGKLAICTTVDHIPSNLWLERRRYIYALLISPLNSDCVNSLRIPSGWSWSPYDEDAKSAHPIGVSTVWAAHAKGTFVYYVLDDGTGNSKQVGVTSDGKVSAPSKIQIFEDDEECIWTGCGAPIVIRKPSPSNNVPPSQCRIDRLELYYDKIVSSSSTVEPSSTIVRIGGTTDRNYTVSNLQLTWPKPSTRKVEVVLLIEKSGDLSSNFQSICSRASASSFTSNLNVKCGGISDMSINVYLADPNRMNKYISLGSATNDQKLGDIFDKARSTLVGNYGSKGSSILNVGTQLMNRSPKSAYHFFIIMTNTAWNAADEAKFVDKANLSNWDLTFVTGKTTRASATKLVSKIPFSWIGGTNWDSSWANTLFKDNVIENNYQTANMRVMNSSLDSLFSFSPQHLPPKTTNEYTMNLTYTINWKRSRIIANSPTISTELAVRGWGTTLVDLEYNLPPIGRNISIRCSDLTCLISFPISDLNNDQLNILFTEVPSHGKLIHPRTGNEIKAGDYLNKFSKDGTAIGVLEKTVIYRRGINGNYTLKYIVDDGCEQSSKYVVNISINAMNVQMVADNKSITVDSGSYLRTAEPFTLESCMLDTVDPYYPIYVRPKKLPDALRQGTLYDSKKQPVTLNTSKKYLLEDQFYYVPAAKPTRKPGESDGVCMFVLEESTSQLNSSNTAWLYVILLQGDQRPSLTFQHTSINIGSGSATSFTPIVGDRSEYELELYLANMPTGNSIYLNDQLITTGGTFPFNLLHGIKPTESDNHEVTLPGFTWGTSATKGTTIKGVFYVKRVNVGNSDKDKSADATLTLTVQENSGKTTNSTCYPVTVPPFDQGDMSASFDLLGTDQLTSPPGSKDMKFMIENLSDDIGRLYRTDTNTPVSDSVSLDASDVYGPTQGDPHFYGSKLSLYLAPVLLSNRTYASGDHLFKYTVFNGYNTSESKPVSISIRPKTILPTSENRTACIQEGAVSNHRVPIVVRNGLPGYLEFDSISDQNLTASAQIDANDPDTAIVTITSAVVGYYSYLPGKTPVLAYTVTYHACEGDKKCNDMTYGIDVYIVHVPHPPTSSEHTIRAVRTHLETVKLPAVDVDEYDIDKLRATLLFDTRPTGQFYLDQEKTQPIDTSAASVQIESVTFYYVCDTLRNDLDLFMDRISYFVTDTTGLTSSQSTLTIFVDPRGDVPETSLERISLDQGISIMFSLSDPKSVTVERPDSSARATITSLPLDSLYECSDIDCTTQTLLDTVPVKLSQTGADSVLLYRPSPSNWGQDYTSIGYTLTDERSKKETNLQLAVDVIHVNAASVLINHGIASTALKQSEVYEFSWSLTDVDTPLEQLYSTLNLTFVNSGSWSLSRCKDDACLDTEIIVTPEDVKNTSYVLQPSVIIRSGDCPFENDTSTHTHDSPPEECSALFKYQLYADQHVVYSTLFTFNLVGSDSLSLSNNVNNVVITYLFVNRPPIIWAPELIVSEENLLNPFIRDNDKDSPTYNQSVTITDPGYRMPCLEKLTMTANTTGTFEYPEELNCTSSIDNAPTRDIIPDDPVFDDNTVVCISTVPNLNMWLPSLRFATNESYISLNFTISDEGCSTSVTENDTAYTASVVTRIELTAKPGSANDNTLSIAAGAAAVVGAAALGALSYFLRNRFTSPPDVYFDVGSESIFTAPENPLFQSSNQEHISPIYRDI